MTKRRKIEITRDDALSTIDEELDAAMERLDGTNERIDNILAGVEDGSLEPDDQPAAAPDLPDVPDGPAAAGDTESAG